MTPLYFLESIPNMLHIFAAIFVDSVLNAPEYLKGFPSACINHADTKYKVQVADCVAEGEQQSSVQAGLHTAAVLSAPSGCVYGHTLLHNILMHNSLHPLTSSVHASKPTVTLTL